MPIEYLDLFRNFKELDIEDKRHEILKVISDEIRLLYLENNKISSYNEPLGLLEEYNDEDEYLNLLFIYTMLLREENDKLIENIFSKDQ